MSTIFQKHRETFSLHEIEHHGDLDNAYSGLAKAGYIEIEVLEKDFNSGSATFSAIRPEGKTNEEIKAVLDEEGVCY